MYFTEEKEVANERERETTHDFSFCGQKNKLFSNNWINDSENEGKEKLLGKMLNI